ncbi:MAG TPA: arsenite methyltransferase [Candidatus Paceibacterota bacterium]|nr:arsenite methyltransferase [Candidatus Paceibacterota bacterium]
MKDDEIKQIVKTKYSNIAKGSCGCGNVSSCCSNSLSTKQISESIGYSEEEINSASEANLGLGCGNPVALSTIKEGDVVLDLGSGAGFDAFLAAKKVGNKGKVIGLDMSEEMTHKAKENAKMYGYQNVEFRLGDIEHIPIEANTIDVILSNCVINLAPNKEKVFSEAYRVLKSDGKMFVSDIVLLEELTQEQRNDKELIAGCVGGAILKDEYIKLIQNAGFKVKVLAEDKKISKRQYNGIKLESLKIEAAK